ncbi:glycosyltransferase [Dethiosulfatarculus sandiegensis]|uniref:glycosyltransferase n=1 Tax=Dethiosulfatarculus sandiegensis TaxID=1429043 RepID=UPI000698B037|nr:glycosyltransferase [Dethiosulfatarculus sandiegensis]
MENKIKVLQVATSLHTGGAEQVIIDLLKWGPQAGFENQVAVLVEEGELARVARDLGVEVHCLSKRRGRDWSMVGAILRLARRIGADLIHAHNNGAGLYAALAGRWGRIPVVTTRHGLYIKPGTGLWLWRLVGFLSTKMVCVGADVRDLAIDRVGLSEKRVRLIFNGVDLKGYAPDMEARSLIREELGLLTGQALLITVGRLSQVKDQAGMLQALALLKGISPLPVLALVGDGPERNSLTALTEELGVKDHVRFLGDRRDVPKLLAASDCFVLSSVSEGISKALLEAMAVGLPVVATNVGGNPELVCPKQTGLLVPQGEPKALAQALATVLLDGGLAQRLGRAGRERVKKSFDVRATAQAYGDLFAELVNK